MKKAEDRRVLRTRSMLIDALTDLMIEKGFEAVTIQDIIDRANVGRSTFYLHFTDKEQLLSESINQLREFLKQQSSNRPAVALSDRYQFGFSLAMLQHAQSHKHLYRAIAGKKGGATVMYHMHQMLTELIGDEILAFLPSSGLSIPKETVIDFVVNTFTTLLTWWMDQNMPCSAVELDRIFHKLTLSGLGGFQE